MKIFSIDGLCFVLSLVLGLVPVLTCAKESRLPNLGEWISIFAATILAVVTFYSAVENANKLNQVENRIASFTVDVLVDFSWATGSNPLLDNGNDGSSSEDELVWLSSRQELIKLYTPTGYTIMRTGEASARFTATLSPKNGAAPLGQQIGSLKGANRYSIFIPLKGYWTNGRDNYMVSVDKLNMNFRINGKTVSHSGSSTQNVLPSKMDQAIFGLLTVQGELTQDIATLFDPDL